ncbi:hypothetical protein BSKO_03558 [Bryopsis sp. KO-2023]|nr:hypothetical protein BSKO_03558 [Bryopsis sp. KO-2023]
MGGKAGTIRLKLNFRPSVKFAAGWTSRKALFWISDDIRTIADLAAQVKEQLGITGRPELLRFSVDGYTAPWGSLTRGVLRDGDVVMVEALSQKRPLQIKEGELQAAQDAKSKENLTKKRKAPPLASAPAQKHGKFNEQLRTTPLMIKGSTSQAAGKAPVSAMFSGADRGKKKAGPSAVKEAAKQTSSSSSESSELEELSTEGDAPQAGPSARKGTANRSKPGKTKPDSSSSSESSGKKKPSTSTSSSSSSSSEDSSSDSSEKKKRASPQAQSSSSSSSEESSEGSSEESSGSEEESESPAEVNQKKRAVMSASKDDATAVAVRQPPVFRDNWPKLTRNPFEKDVVAYKMLEVGADWTPEVTDWRYGSVSAFDTTSRIVTLVPWPDLAVHPDPKIRAHRESLERCAEEEEDDGKKCLDLPQSEYLDDGALHRSFDDFVEVRLVESGAACNNILAPSCSKGQGTPQNNGAQHVPQEKTPDRKLTPCQKRRLRKKKHQSGGLKGGSMSANGGGEKAGLDCRKDVKSVDGTPLSGSDWNDVEKMLADKRKTIIKAAEQGIPVRRCHGSSLLGVLAHIRNH